MLYGTGCSPKRRSGITQLLRNCHQLHFNSYIAITDSVRSAITHFICKAAEDILIIVNSLGTLQFLRISTQASRHCVTFTVFNNILSYKTVQPALIPLVILHNKFFLYLYNFASLKHMFLLFNVTSFNRGSYTKKQISQNLLILLKFTH